MRDPKYSSIDPNTGDVKWRGPLSLEKGDHSHMPQRTSAYLPGDERGHVNASSLGGGNTTANVVPQHHDVNQAFTKVESGERTALQNGARIDSEKTAFVNGQPGERPSAFMISDTVTYPDGQTQTIHHSFTNVSNAEQSRWNEISASLPDTFDAPNPGDTLRDSMDAQSYASLMEETDACLPSISDEYAAADFSGAPVGSDAADASAGAGDGEGGASSDADAD